nr:hypothetical protein [candidate division KSB1 bacterium]NIR71689.1 hypothetical protein [candidate division KSB1 bacterium]NIS26401.1 hypothetical protein [candidate division KSB1 bacterium]NIT73160.1 hypothetical protein [candidate division KSB1 bacterium]NIU27086.1 hypothetical protein [candidate division KSB1 bacterium]
MKRFVEAVDLRAGGHWRFRLMLCGRVGKEYGQLPIGGLGRKNHAGQTVASGVYIYKVKAGDVVKGRKMIFA